MPTASKELQFLRITYLRGPNIWTYRPVLEAWVDIGALEDAPSNTIPGFYERLVSWLPSLVEHQCSVGERGGFLRRVEEGTWMAHVLEHVVLELQNLAGMQVGFGKARQTSQRGIYKVAIRVRNEEVGRAALHAGRDLVMAAIEDRPFDVAGVVEALHQKVEKHHLGASTAHIVQAASEGGIPVIRLTEGNLVQLGYGTLQRRIWTSETERTSAIGENIAADKGLTKRLLQSCGLPVPEGEIVEDADAAWEAAQEIGLPVAIKPNKGSHGRGVVLNLSCEKDVRAAFDIACDLSSEVIVERFVRGDEYRLLVVGDKLVAAARKKNTWLHGDGLDTVETLNHHRGNASDDVTDRVHPENAELMALAARVIGLDIAGVDVVAEDISRPLAEQEAVILEVDAGPGLLMQLRPESEKPKLISEAIVNHLFPYLEQRGRIPIFGITGTQGTAIAQRLAALLRLAGYRVGLACRDGLYFGTRQIESRNAMNWEAGQRLLMNRLIDIAVIESDAALILREGLAYDRCQIGIVTDTDGLDALADDDILTHGQLCQVLRTQVDTVLPRGVAVLNAHDPKLVEMAALCDGSVIFYAMDAGLPAIAEHCAHGGRAVVADDEQVLLIHDNHTTALGINHAPDLEMLAVIAAAWAFGINSTLIRFGIGRQETV